MFLLTRIMKIWLIDFLYKLNPKKYQHSKRLCLYEYKYFVYRSKMRTKLKIEEVRKMEQELSTLNIYINPNELKEIHKKVLTNLK